MVAWLAMLMTAPVLAGGSGTSIGVIHTADSGVGSLRWAIEGANARARAGLDVGGPASDARVYRNTIRNCQRGVWITNLARCVLGNLGNVSTSDDGDNIFGTTNKWHIDNRTASWVRAEGSNFGTTVKAQIDAKIHDKRDDPTLGRVDFVPLQGGVTPSGATETVALPLAGATSRPTTAGVEIAFGLSAPASLTVEVLNVAGRPVAIVQQDTPAGAGLQRLVWTGRTRQGALSPVRLHR